MKREKKPGIDFIPSAIITADWHLRDDVPICRDDDFETEQWKKVQFVSDLQRKYNVPVIHAGDLFHHWKPSPYLLSKCLQYLPNEFMTVFGNHDLPQHSMELAYKSGVWTLLEAGRIKVINGGHWEGQETGVLAINDRKIMVQHVMTFVGNNPWPGCTDKPAHELLESVDCDLLITGHNHKTFTHRSTDGKILINPGSLTRQTADQHEHEPVLFLYDAQNHDIKEVMIPHSKKVITRSHLEEAKQWDSRITAFVENLDKEWQGGANFEQVLESYIQQNELDENVIKIIKSVVYE